MNEDWVDRELLKQALTVHCVVSLWENKSNQIQSDQRTGPQARQTNSWDHVPGGQVCLVPMSFHFKRRRHTKVREREGGGEREKERERGNLGSPEACRWIGWQEFGGPEHGCPSECPETD